MCFWKEGSKQSIKQHFVWKLFSIYNSSPAFLEIHPQTRITFSQYDLSFLMKSRHWRDISQKHLTQLIFPSLSHLSWNIYSWTRLKVARGVICNLQETCPYPLADSKRYINLQIPIAKGSFSSDTEESSFYLVEIWDKLWSQQCFCIWSSFGEARAINLNFFSFFTSVS